MAKELKIYKRLPAGWFVTRDFTTVKNGYIGIHNGKNPFSSKGEYRSGQILVTPAILKHLGKQYQTDKSIGVTAKKTDRQETVKAVKVAKKETERKIRKQLLKASRK